MGAGWGERIYQQERGAHAHMHMCTHTCMCMCTDGVQVYQQELRHIKRFLGLRLDVQAQSKRVESVWLSKLDWLHMVGRLIPKLSRALS